MTTSQLKRFGIPAAVAAGGVTLGALFAPIGIASAQNSGGPTDDGAAEAEGDESTDRSERRGDRAGARRDAKIETLTEALGITAEDLRAAFQDGKSIADVAAEQNVPLADVEAALVAAATERIDAAVESGRIDEERAAEIKAGLAEKVGELVNRTPGERDGERGHRHKHRHSHEHSHRHGHGLRAGAEALTEALGLTGEEIRAGMADGKSLADLAAEQGVEVDALVDALMAGVQEKLDAAVESGRIEADDVAERLADIEEKIEERINAEPGERPDHGHRHRRGFGQRGGDGEQQETVIETSTA